MEKLFVSIVALIFCYSCFSKDAAKEVICEDFYTVEAITPRDEVYDYSLSSDGGRLLVQFRYYINIYELDNRYCNYDLKDSIRLNPDQVYNVYSSDFGVGFLYYKINASNSTSKQYLYLNEIGNAGSFHLDSSRFDSGFLPNEADLQVSYHSSVGDSEFFVDNFGRYFWFPSENGRFSLISDGLADLSNGQILSSKMNKSFSKYLELKRPSGSELINSCIIAYDETVAITDQNGTLYYIENDEIDSVRNFNESPTNLVSNRFYRLSLKRGGIEFYNF